jgi:iron(III) transport system permease protein
VFVDVMKELPITVMLRPFGYDTLAIWVWQMAAESLWTGTALPALAIVVAGLLPIKFLLDTRPLARVSSAS